MISFFRRIFSSKLGLFLTFCFIGLIAFAFATADVSSSGTFGGVTGSGTAATVGDSKLTTAELSQSVNNAFRNEQRENTGLDLKSYINGGGFDDVLERLINSFAIADFGTKYGMAAGKRLVDGEIANIGAFQGADGQFSEENFRRALQQQGINETQLRDDFTRNLLADQLLTAAGFGAAVPQKLVMPYASLLLESREGQIATVPSVAFVDNSKPAKAAVEAFYAKNASRYTIPERRTIRYALFEKSRFNDKIKPTEKEIAGYYNLNKSRYSASETRNLNQVIVPTEAAAKALAAKINGGTTLEQAAQSVGLSAAEVGSISKTDFANNASQAVANAAFAAPSGGIAGPAQSALGWHIVKVESIKQIPARPLAQVRTEIVGELTRSKIEEAMAELTVRLEDEFADGATLGDIAKAEQLKIESTPALLANGQNPNDRNYKPIPEMQRILPIAFTMEADSDPQVVEIIPGQQYAVVAVTDITESAPPPMTQIEQLVTRDYMLDQGSKKAKVVADKIAKAVSGGTSLSKAVADAGVKLPSPERIRSTRADLARQSQQGQVPAPISLMFSMAQGTAKSLAAPRDQGWFVVVLDKLNRGDASKREDLLTATKTQFKQVFGNEYTAQFINAMKEDIGVKRNEDALTAVKNQLIGGR
ncbi:MAG: peptidylprolyl isomerase [Sphingomonadales bacterium]|nr:peptidylprolyl isomerase [Sphingomonadales bacterium]PIX66721.1 MAG: peptidylprolyl isomerase [Sphingomonadales bacterium CG_4_10_14_3_um_filter_58_15]NCO49005.1 peptidylprolyl isomerase [Sphingomonadales bacterium]NCP00421.1 peptidylprolyl isomerase [Sphingomonadales bacterium]NCP26077.1 peptidylprolyl isomerase [Sphingomonadales bacterium]